LDLFPPAVALPVEVPPEPLDELVVDGELLLVDAGAGALVVVEGAGDASFAGAGAEVRTSGTCALPPPPVFVTVDPELLVLLVVPASAAEALPPKSNSAIIVKAENSSP
jgi:hypothetical protein